MYVYADNAATTRPSGTAIEAMTKCLHEVYGNPSSLHSIGQKAAEALQKAREDVAEVLGADFNEIYFTSGGSEADNQAIRSAALNGAARGKKHLISTTIEHHAVLHTLNKLEKEGFEVTLLEVGDNGILDPADLEKAIREDTGLVTVMYANNEIGTIQPIDEIASTSMATEMIKGKSIEEAMSLSDKAVVEALDGLPNHKIHCSVLAEEAVKAAVKDYYDRRGIEYDKDRFRMGDTAEEAEDSFFLKS